MSPVLLRTVMSSGRPSPFKSISWPNITFAFERNHKRSGAIDGTGSMLESDYDKLVRRTRRNGSANCRGRNTRYNSRQGAEKYLYIGEVCAEIRTRDGDGFTNRP
jgi:hypothetical protein